MHTLLHIYLYAVLISLRYGKFFMALKKKRLSKRVTTKTREGRRKKQCKKSKQERKNERRIEKKIDNMPISQIKTKEEIETMREIRKNAEARQKEYEERKKAEEACEDKTETKDDASRKYMKQIHKLVNEADVILEVLDARDPLGSRSPEIERVVQEKGKKLVIVLNKVDLVQRENWTGWLTYIRQSVPAVPFKASTQTQRTHIGHNDKTEQTQEAFGVKALMHVLKNYTRGGISVTVGVIGCPNTGKSSIINSLKIAKACDVKNIPGVTKTLQKVMLDKSIELVDSPGVIYRNSNAVSNAVSNSQRLSTMNIDAESIVSQVYKALPKRMLALYYEVEETDSEDAFLTLLAIKCGKYTKGCVPDKRAAACTVLRDLQIGKIRFSTPVPSTDIAEDTEQKGYIVEHREEQKIQIDM